MVCLEGTDHRIPLLVWYHRARGGTIIITLYGDLMHFGGCTSNLRQGQPASCEVWWGGSIPSQVRALFLVMARVTVRQVLATCVEARQTWRSMRLVVPIVWAERTCFGRGVLLVPLGTMGLGVVRDFGRNDQGRDGAGGQECPKYNK